MKSVYLFEEIMATFTITDAEVEEFLKAYIYQDQGQSCDIVQPKKAGQTCKKCNEFYEYAEEPNQKDGSFKCFSCRNY